MIPTTGGKLFDGLPLCLREYQGSLIGFKTLLDSILQIIHECLVLPSYSMYNMDLNGSQGNCIIEQIRNIDVSNWIPDSAPGGVKTPSNNYKEMYVIVM